MDLIIFGERTNNFLKSFFKEKKITKILDIKSRNLCVEMGRMLFNSYGNTVWIIFLSRTRIFKYKNTYISHIVIWYLDFVGWACSHELRSDRFCGAHVIFLRFRVPHVHSTHRLLSGRVDNRVTHQIVTIGPYCIARGQTMVYWERESVRAVRRISL